MIRGPPRSTRTDTLLPDAPLCRAAPAPAWLAGRTTQRGAARGDGLRRGGMLAEQAPQVLHLVPGIGMCGIACQPVLQALCRLHRVLGQAHTPGQRLGMARFAPLVVVAVPAHRLIPVQLGSAPCTESVCTSGVCSVVA